MTFLYTHNIYFILWTTKYDVVIYAAKNQKGQKHMYSQGTTKVTAKMPSVIMSHMIYRKTKQVWM